MNKPLFRWTVGPVHDRGFLLLYESVKLALNIFGDLFDWFICHNSLDSKQLYLLNLITNNKPITLVEQNWDSCPIPETRQFNKDKRGYFNARGTLWKVCPPRLRMDSHEIIVDNDLIILKDFQEIHRFLRGDHCLLAYDPVRYMGVYEALFDRKDNYNSGFLGLPPQFEFGKMISDTHALMGYHASHSSGDEQGLLSYAITSSNNFEVLKSINYFPAMANDRFNVENPFASFDNNPIAHFVESNRANTHFYWDLYLQRKMARGERIDMKLIRCLNSDYVNILRANTKFV